MAEDAREAGAGIPCSVQGGGRDGKPVPRIYFDYVIGRIGIIGSTIPGTEN